MHRLGQLFITACQQGEVITKGFSSQVGQINRPRDVLVELG